MLVFFCVNGILEFLFFIGMFVFKFFSVLMILNLKFFNIDGDLFLDREVYRSLVGWLMYFCIIRLDIIFVVNKLC